MSSIEGPGKTPVPLVELPRKGSTKIVPLRAWRVLVRFEKGGVREDDKTWPTPRPKTLPSEVRRARGSCVKGEGYSIRGEKEHRKFVRGKKYQWFQPCRRLRDHQLRTIIKPSLVVS